MAILPLLAARYDEEARDGPLDKVEETAFNEAMARIDAIAVWGAPPESAAVPDLARPHINKFKDAIQDSRTKGLRLAANVAGVVPRQRISRLRTPEQLRLRVMQASILAWALLGALTATAGTYILILTNPGFGTPLDLFACFLWGAGLPAGATLATANTSTVSTALSITR